MNTLKEKYSLPVGKWISYYRNGQVLETGTYLAVGMVKTSTALVPGEDGELIYTEVIAEPEGVKTGEWTYYVETGKMVLKESYTEGLKAGEVFMQEEVK
jgi:antitoxin component YwqK of YwqJK toxin-antitoxin module